MATDGRPDLRAIEESILGLSDDQKRELIGRIARSIGPGPVDPPEELNRRQSENRPRLMQELAALPTAQPGPPVEPLEDAGEIDEGYAALNRLIEECQVESGRTGPTEEQARRQYENRLRLMQELAALPLVPHDDGLSNRDHDKILYGSSS